MVGSRGLKGIALGAVLRRCDATDAVAKANNACCTERVSATLSGHYSHSERSEESRLCHKLRPFPVFRVTSVVLSQHLTRASQWDWGGSSAMSGGAGYICCSRSIRGSASGVVARVGLLGGWSQVSCVMPCSESVLLITVTIASSVSAVPFLRSSTRSSLRSGGGVSCINAQQRSKTVRRTAAGTLSVSRSH